MLANRLLERGLFLCDEVCTDMLLLKIDFSRSRSSPAHHCQQEMLFMKQLPIHS